MTPTQRSLKHLRSLGYHACVVEKRLPRVMITVDAFGFGDILAVKADGKITLVQTTSGSNVSARLAKAKSISGPLVAWLCAGGRLLIHGWAKRGARGERKTWQVREVDLMVQDLLDGQSALRGNGGGK